MKIGAYTLSGKNIKISATLRLERKELSGSGSGTDFANEGTKPFALSVSMQIPMDQPQLLTDLAELVRATEDDGEPVVYPLVDDLAAALNINLVIFADNFSAKENDSVRCWDVSFALLEHDSVAERDEQNKTIETKEAAADGTPISGSVADVNSAIENTQA